MKVYTKDEIVDALVERDLDNGCEYEALSCGCKGYSNMSHKELVEWFLIMIEPGESRFVYRSGDLSIDVECTADYFKWDGNDTVFEYV